MHSHRAPCRLRLLSCLSPVKLTCFWSVVVFFLSFGGPLRPRRIFFLHWFLSINLTAKQGDFVTPIHSTAVASHLKQPPPPTLLFGWLWHFLIDWQPPKAWAPPLLFSIFCRSICRPEQRDNPPHTFRPSRVSSQTPPPLLMPTFGWLLCLPIKPSKAFVIFFFVFFLSFNLPTQNEKNTTPYTLHPGRASSPSSLLSLPPTIG